MHQPATYKDLRIIFMGTPEFAVASLDGLVQAGCNIVAVVTAPDKPAGRGMKMNESAVKKYAVSKSIPILQPVKLKDPEFLALLRSLSAQLQVVVAFRMLPEVVWNMPPMGSVNLHASLLPKYRGAAPINWAIINGEKETGLTTFRLQHDIDTGNILMQESLLIGSDETAGELHDRMKVVGARLLLETIKGMSAGTLEAYPQPAGGNGDNDSLPHAPRIFAEDCRIEFNKPVAGVHNHVRGLSPVPGAFTIMDGRVLKIFRSKKEAGSENTGKKPGQYETDGRSYLKFACADGFLQVKELQMEGKKRLKTEDFLRGYRFVQDA